MHYFGPWGELDGALSKYLERKDALHAGKKRRPETGALTVKDLVNAFLNAKREFVNAGELSIRTRTDYKGMTDELVSLLGKSRLVPDINPEDFATLRNKLAQKWGTHRLKKAVQHIRSVFKHAYEAGLINRPTRFGPGFKRPSARTMRLDRAKRGPKLFSRDEVLSLIDAAGVHPRAMILLGINAGYGNADCATLPLSIVDLTKGIIDYPRPKTGMPRRCPLWPESVEALRESLARRPKPKSEEHAGLVFVTKYGMPWGKDIADSPVTKETRKLLDRLGINGGRNYYCLRHTFRTVADEAKDQPAADYIMGHEVAHMSSVYRERISDERLKAVSDHVHTWLFSETAIASSSTSGCDSERNESA